MSINSRRKFLYKGSLLLLTPFIPSFLFSNNRTSFSSNVKDHEMILGKRAPELIGKDYKLIPEAAAAFEKMRAEASKAGLDIFPVSSYRSFQHQKFIWEKKLRLNLEAGLAPKEAVDQILQFSAIPGTSRHHWGTEIDIIDKNNLILQGDILKEEYFEEGSYFGDLKKWLDQNAHRFGFCETYTRDENRQGFKYEPWHFSYQPISKNILEDFLKIDIAGFIASEEIKGYEYINRNFVNDYKNKYVLGINQLLLPDM